jgi:hypothetical protein
MTGWKLENTPIIENSCNRRWFAEDWVKFSLETKKPASSDHITENWMTRQV